MGELTLERVYADYHRNVLGYVCNRVNDLNLAEDITADIFLKIAEHLDAFDPEKASLSTWVYTIASRTLTDHFRSHRIFVEIPEDNDGILPDALIDRNAPDSMLLLEEQQQLLAQALQALPQRNRDLIILHYYNGLTLKEAAEKMNMSYINAKVMHRKVLSKLKDMMNSD